MRRWYDVFWMPHSSCQFQNTSAYNLCYSAIQYTPNYRLLYWLPKFQTLCFRLQQERVPVFRITTPAQNHADITLPNAANQKMSRILKNLINFRNWEVLVTDRLQSINLKFYALNQQVNLLFALFIFVLRRKKWIASLVYTSRDGRVVRQSTQRPSEWGLLQR